MSKIRISKDSELATPEAINFRIESIKKENGGILTPAAANRIAALRLRLPKDPTKPLAPAISPALLINKGDEEWGDRRKYAVA